jgi:PAS domain S-box-containing protein
MPVVSETDVNARVLDSEMFGGAVGACAFIGSVLEASTEYSIIATDQHGVISLWSEGARRLYGYEPGKIIGRHKSILHTDRDVVGGLPGLMMGGASEHGKWEGTVERVRKDGSGFTARVVMTLRCSVEGKPIWFLLMSSDITDELRLAAERTRLQVGRVRDALDQDRLVLYAQPIVALSARAKPSEELLVRMVGQNGEIIAPGCFLPVAEKSGLIGEIDRWVITQAAILAAGGRRVCANLSADSIGNLDLLPWIEHQLSEAHADPANVVFEITDTELMGNLEAGKAFTRGISQIGCAIALDDFDTGYGSFHLSPEAPHRSHQDRRRLRPRPRIEHVEPQHLVKATINIAQGFGPQTIAEGVEDSETLELLRDSGVDLAQGFHFGRPAPLESADHARAAA